MFVGADRISSQNEDGFYLVKVETSERSFSRENEEYKLFLWGSCCGRNNYWQNEASLIIF